MSLILYDKSLHFAAYLIQDLILSSSSMKQQIGIIDFSFSLQHAFCRKGILPDVFKQSSLLCTMACIDSMIAAVKYMILLLRTISFSFCVFFPSLISAMNSSQKPSPIPVIDLVICTFTRGGMKVFHFSTACSFSISISGFCSRYWRFKIQASSTLGCLKIKFSIVSFMRFARISCFIDLSESHGSIDAFDFSRIHAIY